MMWTDGSGAEGEGCDRSYHSEGANGKITLKDGSLHLINLLILPFPQMS